MIEAYCNSSSKALSCESWLILVGKPSKLFPSRYKDFNEDRQPIPSGISIIPQLLKCRVSKEVKHDNCGGNAKPLQLVNESSSSLLKSAIEDGGLLMADFPAVRYSKDF